MSADWPMIPLGDLTVNLDSRRKPVKEADRKPGPYPYYGASGIVDFVDGYLFDGDYLLIAEDGENLRSRQLPIAFIAKGMFWVNNHAHIVTGNEKADTRYLMYALQSTDINAFITGAVMPKLTKGNLNRIPLPCPPLDIQCEIVRILGSLDDKIELNRQINQTLEQIAQTIFKSWFVDFEPVKAKIAAKAAGRDPECAAMCAISGKTDAEFDQLTAEQRQQLAATAALFPDELVESELGLVPVGWEVCPLSEMIRLIGGGTPKKSEPSFWGGDIPWFSVKDAPNDGDVFVLDTSKKITKVGLDKSSTKLLSEGTTIISARGTVGKLALVGTPMAMNQSCYGVVGGRGIGPFYNYFNLKQAVETLRQNTHGAVFDTITRTTFDTVITVRGNNDLILKFDDLVFGFMQMIKENLRETGVLAGIRYTLLPKLLTGEI